MRSHFCSIMCSLALSAGCAQSAIINVPADQPTIQDAIAAAVNGDEVVVAPGIYAEQINFLGKAITVRSSGGAAVTSITGGGASAPLVTFATSETAASRLQGFTLTGAASATAVGGAISINLADPTISDCIIIGNVLSGGASGAGANIVDGDPVFLRTTFTDNTNDGVGGSALTVSGASVVTITDCAFNNNEDVNAAGNPGAITIGAGTLFVNNSTFTGNDAAGGGLGGAIAAVDSEVVITGGLFVNNGTTDGGLGGAIYMEGGSLTVTGTTFRENVGGGAIYASEASLIITGATFIDNINEGGAGGGVGTDGGSTTITGSTFTGNRAVGGYGGGVGIGSGLTSGTFLITDCTFRENQSPGGSGAAFAAEGSFFASLDPVTGTIDRCTFIDNGLIDDPDNGGSGSAVEFRRRTVGTITSSLFTGNTGNTGAVAIDGSGRASVINCTLVDNVPQPGNRTFFVPSTGSLAVRNSIVRGDLSGNRRMFQPSLPAIILSVTNSNISGGYSGAGNINADPQFVDDINGDYRLTATSPSLDTGDNSFVPPAAMLDLDGLARISGSSVDMGAYELGGAAACDDIDFNNNGVFPEDQDVIDFFEVLAGGTPATCDPVEGCNDIDFNNNDVFPEDQDVVDFFNVLAGGECP